MSVYNIGKRSNKTLTTDSARTTILYDYRMQGASAARLPALFFVHNRQPHTSDSTFRSIDVCSVHLAFGQGGKSGQ